MIVYLMRHGQADTGPEVERGLTEAGMEAARKVSLRCRAAGVSPALILTSTYRRAIQTAEIAAAALDSHVAIERYPALLPHCSPFDVWDVVRERRPEGDVLIVAHEPLLSAVAAFLLDTPALRLRVTTAAVIAIELQSLGAQPDGTLLWMMTPRLA